MQKRHSFATGCQCLDLVVTRADEAGLVAQGKCLLDPAREHVLDALGEIGRNADLPFEAAGKHVRFRRLGYRVHTFSPQKSIALQPLSTSREDASVTLTSL